MARYAYDVDSRQKLLDTHKQFSGGLKTVDTDDSVKTVYMRDMENLSLSEFGFIEKRYGQYLDSEKEISGITKDSVIQANYVYTRNDKTVDEILIIDSKLYLSINGGDFELVDIIHPEIKDNGEPYRYPNSDTFSNIGFDTSAVLLDKGGKDIIDTRSLIPEGYDLLNTNDYHFLGIVKNHQDLDYQALGLQIGDWVLETYYYKGIYKLNSSYAWEVVAESQGLDLFIESLANGEIEGTDAYRIGDAIYYFRNQNPEATAPMGYFEETNFYEVASLTDPRFDNRLDKTIPYSYREIQATRIDENLYFMTGVYPIYYKGDGKFYIMPIYEPTNAEVSQFSHNLLENDFEDLYEFTAEHSVMTIDEAAEEDLIDSDIPLVKKNTYYNGVSTFPKIPYNNEDDVDDENAGLNVKISYDLDSSATELSTSFTEFYVHDTYLQNKYNSLLPYVYHFSFGDADSSTVYPQYPDYNFVPSSLSNKSEIIGQPVTDFEIHFPNDEYTEPLKYVDYWKKAMGDSTESLDDAPFKKGDVARFRFDYVPTDSFPSSYVIGSNGEKVTNEASKSYYYYAEFVGTNNVEDSKTYIETRNKLLNSYWPERFVSPIRFIPSISVIGASLGIFSLVYLESWLLNSKFDLGFKHQTNPLLSGWKIISMADDSSLETDGDSNPMSGFKYTTPVRTDNYSTDKTFITSTPLYTEKPASNNILYELFPVVFTRPAGGTEAEWLEIDEDYYVDRKTYSNSGPGARYDILDTNSQDTMGIFENPNGRILDNTAPFTFRVRKLPYGLMDIKTALVYRKSGYYDDLEIEDTVLEVTSGAVSVTGTKTIHRWKQESWIVDEEILRSVTVTNEKLEDYKEIPLQESSELPALWTCNKVFNHYGKLLAYGSLYAGDYIFTSHPSYHNYFPYFFTMQFKTDYRQELTNITPFMNVLVVQSATYTWGLSGIDAVAGLSSSYNQFTISPIYGTIAPKSVRPVRNHLYFLSLDGIVALKALYANDQTYNVELLDKNIRNIVPFTDPDAVGIQWDDQYWLQFPSTGETFRYYVDKKAWVKDAYWTKQTEYLEDGETLNPDFVDFQGIHEYQRVSGKYLSYITKPMLVKRDSESYGIYKIMIDKSLPTDLDYNVFSKFETSFLNQDYPFHPKQYKEVKFDFTIQNEYNVKNAAIYNDTLENFNDANDIELIPNHWYQLELDVDDDIFDLIQDGNGYYTGDVVEGIDSEEIWDGNLFLLFTSINPMITILEDGETIATFDEANGLFKSKGIADYDVVYTRYSDTQATETTDEDVYVSLYDATYDDVITFRTWVMTEDNLLNLDNEINSYDAELAEIEQNLGTNFGEQWVFGSSEFGNRTLTTKTVRLAGKGKNIKVYFEEEGKTKWTLETLGIMFKLKRARGTR